MFSLLAGLIFFNSHYKVKKKGLPMEDFAFSYFEVIMYNK